MSDPAMAVPAKTEKKGYLAWVLFVLVVVYTFNFLDRQIIGILAIPIQKELGVSDTMMGVMRGLSFALFYSTLGVPIAWLADRKNRVWIITGALTVWSAMTAACGMVTTPLQLFLARMGVGVGEAGGIAPAYSIISDYFPPHRRATALAIYSLGIPIGAAVGIVFGGVVATLLDWRAAFIIVGIMGMVLAPIFRLSMKEPPRGRFDGAHAKVDPAPVGEVVRTLISKKSFWLMSFGAASSSIMGYGVFAWIPAFLARSFGDQLGPFLSFLPAWMTPGGGSTLLYVGYFFGMVLLIGGTIGIFMGGYVSDHLGKKDKAAYALVPAVAFVITVPCYVAGVLSTSLTLLFFALLVPTALSLAWLGPVVGAFQHIVPPNMRATATSIFLLINNFLGLALGDVLLGGMSDLLKTRFAEESLRYSIFAGNIFYIVAAVLFFLAARHLRKDWID